MPSIACPITRLNPLKEKALGTSADRLCDSVRNVDGFLSSERHLRRRSARPLPFPANAPHEGWGRPVLGGAHVDFQHNQIWIIRSTRKKDLGNGVP